MKECPREKAGGASLEQEHIEPARELLHENAAQTCVKGKRANRACGFSDAADRLSDEKENAGAVN